MMRVSLLRLATFVKNDIAPLASSRQKAGAF
jgi:hypothetical protein